MNHLFYDYNDLADPTSTIEIQRTASLPDPKKFASEAVQRFGRVMREVIIKVSFVIHEHWRRSPTYIRVRLSVLPMKPSPGSLLPGSTLTLDPILSTSRQPNCDMMHLSSRPSS